MLDEERIKIIEQEIRKLEKERDELLKEGKKLRWRLFEFFDKLKISKVQSFISKQNNN